LENNASNKWKKVCIYFSKNIRDNFYSCENLAEIYTNFTFFTFKFVIEL
jgi:hypothetical protein